MRLRIMSELNAISQCLAFTWKYHKLLLNNWMLNLPHTQENAEYSTVGSWWIDISNRLKNIYLNSAQLCQAHPRINSSSK